MKRLLLICLGIAVAACLWGADLKIQRERAVLRSGPGSWFQVVQELPLGSTVTVIDNDTDDTDSDQWIKVSFNSKSGYISISSTKKMPPKNNVFQAMANQKTDLTSSRHGVSAGVKGFGERFSKTFRGDQNFVEIASNYRMDARQYKQFKKDTYKGFNINRNKKQILFPKQPKSEYFTFSEEGFGLGVASAIASQGLVNDVELQNYVNNLGNVLAEASNVSDIEFKFFVLNVDAANAYACPGGYIFVTRGMIKQCANEAELSCVIAHEIIHVIYSHGMNELEKRKHRIIADQSFDEMDEEMPEEDEAFSMYETIIKGRLDAYEQEADELGMLLAGRAGYDPTTLSSLLSRLLNASGDSNNQHYRKENIKSRMNWVNSYLAKKKFPNDLISNNPRFEKFKGRI